MLLVIAAWVWWGNIKLIAPGDQPRDTRVDQEENTRRPAENKTTLTYSDPVINPFYRAAEPSQRPKSQSAPQKLKVMPELPPGVKLTGFVRRGISSQAVLTAGGETRVLASGDSLFEWHLIEIINNGAVFRSGETTDTMWIHGTR